MKIAFVSEWGDPGNPNLRSGVTYSIYSNMMQNGAEVIPVLVEKQDRSPGDRIFTKAKSLFYNKILRGKFGFYNPLRRRQFLEKYAQQAEEKLKTIDCDLLFCPGTLPIAYLETFSKPIAIWVDATFANYIDYYPGFENLHKDSINDGNAAEQCALQKCRLAVYTSKWAAQSAIKDYGCDEKKLHIIPRGANLSTQRNEAQVNQLIEDRCVSDTCNILFMDTDWERKGGSRMMQIAEHLHQQGIPIRVHAVGFESTPIINPPSWLQITGRLNKSEDRHVQMLDEIFNDSYALLLPTNQEAFGIVYAEAASYGLPSLARNTGGVSDACIHEKMGRVFDDNAAPEVYATYIRKLWEDKSHYRDISNSAFQAYQSKYIWKNNVKQFLDLCAQL